jgi:hypothetical protein
MVNLLKKDLWAVAAIRRIRLLILLEAAETAGLVPIPILQLHTFAYLSNVLAPVWDMPPLDGKILKRKGGPFYPEIQHELDLMVGAGLVIISDISHLKDEDNRWRLEGKYKLNLDFAGKILTYIDYFPEERRFSVFAKELAYALSALSDEEFTLAMGEDATYSDPMIDVGNVIDFAEWRNMNYTSTAANLFKSKTIDGTSISTGEQLHMYVRHLHRRMHGG